MRIELTTMQTHLLVRLLLPLILLFTLTAFWVASAIFQVIGIVP